MKNYRFGKRQLAVDVFALTFRSECRPYRSVRAQVERAAMSVSNNIAEGLNAARPRKRSHFFTSLADPAARLVQSLCLCEQLPVLSDLKS